MESMALHVTLRRYEETPKVLSAKPVSQMKRLRETLTLATERRRDAD